MEPDRDWTAAGSAWAPARNSWEEDVVSGPKWSLGGGRRLWVCGGWAGCSELGMGLRLRGPEESVVWAGMAASGFVLWSGRPGARPSTSCELRSSSYRSPLSDFPLQVKIKTKLNISTWATLNLTRPQSTQTRFGPFQLRSFSDVEICTVCFLRRFWEESGHRHESEVIFLDG